MFLCYHVIMFSSLMFSCFHVSIIHVIMLSCFHVFMFPCGKNLELFSSNVACLSPLQVSNSQTKEFALFKMFHFSQCIVLLSIRLILISKIHIASLYSIIFKVNFHKNQNAEYKSSTLR